MWHHHKFFNILILLGSLYLIFSYFKQVETNEGSLFLLTHCTKPFGTSLHFVDHVWNENHIGQQGNTSRNWEMSVLDKLRTIIIAFWLHRLPNELNGKDEWCRSTSLVRWNLNFGNADGNAHTRKLKMKFLVKLNNKVM